MAKTISIQDSPRGDQGKKFKFTKTSIDALVYTGKQENYSDATLTGFHVRVNEESKTYFVYRRLGSIQKRITVGRHGILTVDQARATAMQLLADLERGIDPQVERKKAVAAMTAAKNESTFGILAKRWYTDYATFEVNGRPRLIDAVKSNGRMVTNGAPIWNMQLSEIDRQTIAALHRKLTKDVGPVGANRFIQRCRSVWNWGRIEGLYTLENPFENVRMNPEKARKTFVEPHQLPQFWQALQGLSNEVIRNYMVFTFFTGCRPEESIDMLWDNVDLERLVWTKPDTKTGEEHILPITPYLVDILRRTPRKKGNPHVWPAQRVRTVAHLSNYHKSWDKLVTAAKLDGVVFRDLRRTFATALQENGFERSFVKSVLGHKQSGDVTARYVIHRLSRIRDAMAVTQQWILDVAEGRVKPE